MDVELGNSLVKLFVKIRGKVSLSGHTAKVVLGCKLNLFFCKKDIGIYSLYRVFSVIL
jgi:hypothetical protein